MYLSLYIYAIEVCWNEIIKSQSSPKVRVLIIPSSNAFMTINKNASIQDIFVSESITD